MTLRYDLGRIAIAAERLLSDPAFEPYDARPLQLSGAGPKVTIPSHDEFLGEDVLASLPSAIRPTIEREIDHALSLLCRQTLEAYASAMALLTSQEDVGGITDRRLENEMSGFFEVEYGRSLKVGAQTIRAMVAKYFPKQVCSIKRSSAFPIHSVNVLEAAYFRSTVLTSAETHLVAEAACISPQQVRTWFQNKRNRGKKAGHIAFGPDHVSATKSRAMSSLPKRGQSLQSEPQEVLVTPERHYLSSSRADGRIIRSLPRRASPGSDGESASTSSCCQSFVHSPSSLSSNSTDSVPANGGFISPFHMHIPLDSHQTQISFAWDHGVVNVPVAVLKGAEPPNLHFDPPIPLHMSFVPNFGANVQAKSTDLPEFADGVTIAQNTADCQESCEMRLDHHDAAPSPGLESIESLLQNALDDPSAVKGLTLLGSPQFTVSPVYSPPFETDLSHISSFDDPPDISASCADDVDFAFLSIFDGMFATPPGAQWTPSRESLQSASSESFVASPGGAVCLDNIQIPAAACGVSAYHQSPSELDMDSTIITGSPASAMGYHPQGFKVKGAATEDHILSGADDWACGFLPVDSMDPSLTHAIGHVPVTITSSPSHLSTLQSSAYTPFSPTFHGKTQVEYQSQRTTRKTGKVCREIGGPEIDQWLINQ